MSVQQNATEAERRTLTESIRQLTKDLELKHELIGELFERVEEGIVVIAPDLSMRRNRAADEILGTSEQEDDWQQTWGFFDLDTKERIDPAELPGIKSLRHRARVAGEFLAVTPRSSEGIAMASTAAPLTDGGAIAAFRDIGARRTAQLELEKQNLTLAERDAEHRLLIERLRIALGELSTPVLQVADGVLVMPIIGVLDRERSDQIAEKLLEEIVRARARTVILDVTGVEFMDTNNADRFAKLAQSVELLGARCLLSGIQPSVAQSLVALGVSLEALTPYRNLAAALIASKRTAPPKTARKGGSR